MTLTLTLIRHAKSDWADPTRDDHDRPLNSRGIRSAKALGPWIAERGLPGEVLCSTATRAVQTWEGISTAVPAVDLRLIGGLYHAPALRMLEVLRQASASSVAMVGHNPGIAEFAELLAETPPTDPQFFAYPTGATTVFQFDAPAWSAVGPGLGAVRGFVVPRELV